MRWLDVVNIEREKPKAKVVQFLGWGYLKFSVVLLVSLSLPSMTFFVLPPGTYEVGGMVVQQLVLSTCARRS